MIWSFEVSENSLGQAKIIIDYLIEQKFALMPPKLRIDTCPSINSETNISTGSSVLDENYKYLSKFLSYRGTDIMASDVSKFRLMPPSKKSKKNKYPVDECREFMREVSKAGFGELHNDRGTQRSLTFRKRAFRDLQPKEQETLKKLNLSESLYNSFLHESTSAETSGELEMPPLMSNPTGSQEDSE